jgi:hypothetical protein
MVYVYLMSILAQEGFPSGPSTTIPDQGLFGFDVLIQNIYNYSIWVLGIAVFLMVFAAGFKWLTAAGNAGKISEARDMIFKAVIGAILLVSSVIILQTINPDLANNSFTLPKIPSGSTGGLGSNSCATCTCRDPGNTVADYDGAVATSSANVLSDPVVANALNTLANRQIFLDAVVNDLQSRSLRATTNVLNGNDIPGSAIDLIAVWNVGDSVVERYDILTGGKPSETIGSNATVDFTGDIPLSCAF